ncbi:MAG: porin [Hoeflea sp.]|uniref:porin n=1 Tax=Hoeflea sp. TaxID=1940281 RepID=UPI0032EFD30F
MNIKSLLLGSAAALVAVSGARAADAIIAAEPEPVEYVRVCDAFGVGFFYIPGTETCLRIGGYVRYDISGGDLLDVNSATGDETYNKRARASFQVSTASETEMGTLRTFVETRWQYDTNGLTNALGVAGNPSRVGTANGYQNDGEFSINFAWIQLGGLRVGKDESYFTTFTGYGGSVINDTLAGGYGPFDTNLISYTYNGGAFRAGIAFEQGDDSTNFAMASTAVPAVVLTAAQTNFTSGWGIDDYMPHVVIGAGYNAGMIDLSAVVAFDTRDDFVLPPVGLQVRGGWTGKLRADVTINDQASIFAMLMYGENSSAYTSWANGAATDETFSVIAGGSYQATDKVKFNTQIQWVEANTNTGGPASDEWSVVGNMNYTVVPGLVVTPELAWYDNGVAGGDEFGATLRVQRSF